ncbi:hypothetical protein ACE6H2_020673 [Prunus campanulata]
MCSPFLGVSSLLEDRDCILSRVRWQILGRLSVNIWNNKWIPNSKLGIIHPRAPVHASVPHVVADLTDRAFGSWNLDQIVQLISAEECTAIWLLPICASVLFDDLLWPHEKDGVYFIRSGYHLIQGNMPPSSFASSSSSHVICKSTWKTI